MNGLVVYEFIGTKMIGLLIIAVLLIILIVVAVRSSETCIEPFYALSGDNYVTGIYTTKIGIKSISNNAKINGVGLVDYVFPNEIIMLVKNKDALPSGIQWTQLDAGYCLSNHKSIEYKRIYGGSNKTIKCENDPIGTKYTHTTVGEKHAIGESLVMNNSTPSGDILKSCEPSFRFFNKNAIIERPEPSTLEVMCFKKEKTTGTCKNTHPSGIIMLSINPSWTGKTLYECKKCLLKTSKDSSLKFNEAKSDTWTVPEPVYGNSDTMNNDTVITNVKATFGLYLFRITKWTMPAQADITTYPSTYNVNLFVNDELENSDVMDPIDNDYSKGIYSTDIDASKVEATHNIVWNDNAKKIIDSLYPVGTVLLFMCEIDLSKQWPGTKWKDIDYAYIGHDPDTKMGESFGKDIVKPIPDTYDSLKLLNSISFSKSATYVKMYNNYLEQKYDMEIHNHLPRYLIKAYVRTG